MLLYSDASSETDRLKILTTGVVA